jgi:hypothetical protein
MGLSLLLLDRVALVEAGTLPQEVLGVSLELHFLLVVAVLVSDQMGHLLMVLRGLVLVAVVHLAGLRVLRPVVVPLQYLIRVLPGVNQELVGVVTLPEMALTEAEQ